MKNKSNYSECLDLKLFWNVIVWSKGQIVIPSEVRKMLNLSPGDSMMVTVKHGKAIWLIKSTDLESFIALMQEELDRMKK
jgi:AbrB family looped-hinge helix DNA binding protein